MTTVETDSAYDDDGWIHGGGVDHLNVLGKKNNPYSDYTYRTRYTIRRDKRF